MTDWNHDPELGVPDGAEQTWNGNPKRVRINNCPDCDRRHLAALVSEAGSSFMETVEENSDADLVVHMTAEYEWYCGSQRYRTTMEQGEPFADVGSWRKSREESRAALRGAGLL